MNGPIDMIPPTLQGLAVGLQKELGRGAPCGHQGPSGRDCDQPAVGGFIHAIHGDPDFVIACATHIPDVGVSVRIESTIRQAGEVFAIIPGGIIIPGFKP